ncbi:MAG: hypothetical protein UV38_C0001G0264 [candidate division TM6 bacterium GW2011_GWE2_42_60]|nr:MAG: hypothetical protein UV38_C0001G0264 [candidate division TM6 bacterium GW2011_GWE2_42_60]
MSGCIEGEDGKIGTKIQMNWLAPLTLSVLAIAKMYRMGMSGSLTVEYFKHRNGSWRIIHKTRFLKTYAELFYNFSRGFTFFATV